jgi:putative NADH-flavin reductase
MVLTMLTTVPVIVVGADTEIGEAIARRLYQPPREVRVFVTDPDRGLEMKRAGFKVAIGDVSDESHVEAASTRCFSAVLVAEASADDRERSFSTSSDQVLRGWAQAVSRSEVTRVIWVTGTTHPETSVDEVAVVDPSNPDAAGMVFELDEAASLS